MLGLQIVSRSLEEDVQEDVQEDLEAVLIWITVRDLPLFLSTPKREGEKGTRSSFSGKLHKG